MGACLSTSHASVPEVALVQQGRAGGVVYSALGPPPPAVVAFRYPPPPTYPQHHHRAFAALPPDPSQHHMVPCTITRPGVLGLGLSPAPGGAGVCVDLVAPDTAVAPPPQKGDRVHTVAGADVLMVR